MVGKLLEKIGIKGTSELVGVDIGTTSITMCTLKKTKGGFKLDKLARRTYDEDLLHESNIIDAGFVAGELQGILKENGIKGHAAATALSSYTVITKKISIPFLSEDDLENTIRLEVESVIPFPLKDIYYSYYIMGVDEEKEGMMNALIVAAKKEIVDEYKTVFSQAGLTLAILDVDIFGITNLVEHIYGVSSSSVLAADVGASVMNIAILKGESVEFTREVLIGGKYITADIAKIMKSSQKEAEEKKLRGDEEIMYLLDDFVITVSAELMKTINFYVATKPRESVGKIFLTGGSSLVPGLKERVEKETGVEVVFIDPFLMLPENERLERHQKDSAFAPISFYLSSRVGDLNS